MTNEIDEGLGRRPQEIIAAFRSGTRSFARKEVSSEPEIVICIPVFGGREFVLECLLSVGNSLAENDSEFRVMVVDDCGPDEVLRRELRQLHEAGSFDLIINEKNIGFPGSCNAVFDVATPADVIILNSDTLVYGDWVDRLRGAAYSRPEIGTVTALTNEGSIASYPTTGGALAPFPIKEIHSAIEGLESLSVEAPTGVGHCMFIKRTLLETVGYFDEITFGKGYGEENDLCQRGALQGFVNILCPGVYVEHRGGGSFGPSKNDRIARAKKLLSRMYPNYLSDVSAFIERDELAVARQKIDVQLLRNRSPKGSVLLITHDRGGGTERAVQETGRRFEAQGRCVVVARPKSSTGGRVLNLEHLTTEYGSNLGSFDLGTMQNEFVALLKDLGVNEIQIHHVIDLHSDIVEQLPDIFELTGAPFTVFLHDFYSMCPRVNLVDDTQTFCGIPDLVSCQECFDRLNTGSRERPTIQAWISRFDRFLRSALSIYVPSHSTAQFLARRFPAHKFFVEPHAVSRVELGLDLVPHVEKSRPVEVHQLHKIVIIGAISVAKGSRLLRDVAVMSEQSASPLLFELIGYTDRDHEFAGLKNFNLHGPYEDSELVDKILHSKPSIIWFPAVWPETFAYTLSAALECPNIPIVAFDIGAVANRVIDAGRGWLLPLEIALSPDRMLNNLNEFAKLGTSMKVTS